jgi:Plasmid pRiA4b ORF-3-like protein/LexA DNA binding domain
MPRPKTEPGGFTPQQGQYLRFLYDYIQKHGKVPAQSEMSERLRLSSPSGMLKSLESKGLISREKGDPQSLKILVPAHLIPLREGGDVLPFLGEFGEKYPNLARWLAIGGRLELGLPAKAPSEESGRNRIPNSLVRLGTPEEYVWTSWRSAFAKSPDELLKEAEEEVVAFFPEPPIAKGIPVCSTLYQLKVTLRHSEPAIWRRFVVPAELPLVYLHDTFQIAFGWDNSHLHGFYQGRVSYGPIASDEDNEDADDMFSFAGDFERDEAVVPLTELLHKPKDKFHYLYDFGDSWYHDVVLEKLIPNEEAAAQILCTDGKRAAPVDDCGGMGGFEYLIEAHANPKHTDHKRALEWLEEDFDPEHVDFEKINKALAELK